MTHFTKTLFLTASFCFFVSSLDSAPARRERGDPTAPCCPVSRWTRRVPRSSKRPARPSPMAAAVSDHELASLNLHDLVEMQGFTTVVREVVELTGCGSRAINAELRVGAVAETITVRAKRLSSTCSRHGIRPCSVAGEIVRALPASRGYGNYLAAMPAIQATGFNTSVGDEHQLLYRPCRPRQRARRPDRRPDRRVAVQRWRCVQLRVRHEQLDRSPGVDLRRPRRSRSRVPTFNIIPKTGGNSFSGNVFCSWAAQLGLSSNIDDELRALGFAEAPGLLKTWYGQLLAQPADQARQDLVLRQHAHHGQLRRHAKPVR